MRTFTCADVISWGPCYGADGVRRLAKGMPKRGTAHETAERDWQVTELVRLIHKEEV